MVKYKAYVTRESQTGDWSDKYIGETLHDTKEQALAEAEQYVSTKSNYAYALPVEVE